MKMFAVLGVALVAQAGGGDPLALNDAQLSAKFHARVKANENRQLEGLDRFEIQIQPPDASDPVQYDTAAFRAEIEQELRRAGMKIGHAPGIPVGSVRLTAKTVRDAMKAGESSGYSGYLSLRVVVPGYSDRWAVGGDLELFSRRYVFSGGASGGEKQFRDLTMDLVRKLCAQWQRQNDRKAEGETETR